MPNSSTCMYMYNSLYASINNIAFAYWISLYYMHHLRIDNSRIKNCYFSKYVYATVTVRLFGT